MKTRNKTSVSESRTTRTLSLSRSASLSRSCEIRPPKQESLWQTGKRAILQKQACSIWMRSLHTGKVTRRHIPSLARESIEAYTKQTEDVSSMPISMEQGTSSGRNILMLLMDRIYTDIYAGAKSVCKEKYNQKSHEPGLGSRVNHRYRQGIRLIYRKLWGRSTFVWTGKQKAA